jgi:transcriptional regulator of acetoin/glycerol metabolism
MLRKDGLEHAERVYTAVRWADPPAKQGPESERLLRSWERSLENYGLDPGRTAQPRILTGAHLRERQESVEAFLRIARHGVRNLYQHVRDANYVVLLTDPEGVTLDFIGQPSLDRELKRAGLYLGSVWTESEEGTCGVGTAIVEGAPITVHKREHFRAPNTTLTCSAAPIFDLDGKVRAILDASALYSPEDRKSQNLVLKFVVLAAEMIENAHFLDCCRHAWVLQASPSAEFLQVQTEYLIAFDESGAVLAMNRRAKAHLLAGQQPAPGKLSIEALFDLRLQDLLAGSSPRRLTARTSGLTYFAQLRAPVRAARVHALHESTLDASAPRGIEACETPHAQAPLPARASRCVVRSPAGQDTLPTIHPSALSKADNRDILNTVSEHQRLTAALRQHRWQFAAAARALGISRATLYRKAHKHGIVSPNKLDSDPSTAPR